MTIGNAENFTENREFYPAKVATFVQKHSELAITGSVAYYLQTGLSFNDAIEKANDVDIFCDGERRDDVIKESVELSSDTKAINVLSQQERFKFKTTQEDFTEISTEYGPIKLIPIKVMATLDLERADDFLENKEYKFDQEKFKKLYKKLNNYIEVLEDANLLVKLKDVTKEFSKHLE